MNRAFCLSAHFRSCTHYPKDWIRGLCFLPHKGKELIWHKELTGRGGGTSCMFPPHWVSSWHGNPSALPASYDIFHGKYFPCKGIDSWHKEQGPEWGRKMHDSVKHTCIFYCRRVKLISLNKITELDHVWHKTNTFILTSSTLLELREHMAGKQKKCRSKNPWWLPTLWVENHIKFKNQPNKKFPPPHPPQKKTQQAMLRLPWSRTGETKYKQAQNLELLPHLATSAYLVFTVNLQGVIEHWVKNEEHTSLFP